MKAVITEIGSKRLDVPVGTVVEFDETEELFVELGVVREAKILSNVFPTGTVRMFSIGDNESAILEEVCG